MILCVVDRHQQIQLNLSLLQKSQLRECLAKWSIKLLYSNLKNYSSTPVLYNEQKHLCMAKVQFVKFGGKKSKMFFLASFAFNRGRTQDPCFVFTIKHLTNSFQLETLFSPAYVCKNFRNQNSVRLAANHHYGQLTPLTFMYLNI